MDSSRVARKEKSMKPLRIVVMSATMNVDHFSDYFDKAPVIYVEGRQHKVDVLYSSQPQSDYVYASLGEGALVNKRHCRVGQR